MKISDLFLARYNDNRRNYNFDGVDFTYEDIKFAFTFIAYEQNELLKQVTKEEIEEAVSKKFLIHKEYSNWQARQTNRCHFYSLSAKGIKALIKFNPEMKKEI